MRPTARPRVACPAARSKDRSPTPFRAALAATAAAEVEAAEAATETAAEAVAAAQQSQAQAIRQLRHRRMVVSEVRRSQRLSCEHQRQVASASAALARIRRTTVQAKRHAVPFRALAPASQSASKCLHMRRRARSCTVLAREVARTCSSASAAQLAHAREMTAPLILAIAPAHRCSSHAC